MKFNRKIAPNTKSKVNFITKKRLREDEINFQKLRSYRLDRVKKELEKNNLEACILFDPVNARYALDTVNMSVYNMHNLTRYCFVPVSGPVILYEYFNCEGLSSHLNLIDEIRPAITWDYFSNGAQASGGTGLYNSTIGSKNPLANLFRPINKPRGTPTIIPRINPKNTLKNESQI